MLGAGAPHGGGNHPNPWLLEREEPADGFSYDAAGNLTLDNIAHYFYGYDATGQQVGATNQISGYYLNQSYDGDGLRAVKNDNGAITYYLRSSVLGGAVVTELDSSGGFSRGYFYRGDQLLAVQQSNHMYWVHEDAVTKSQRTTDVYGNVTSSGVVELDPWGANTARSSATVFQPQNFTSYVRDANGDLDAMARRYSPTGRFSQPDPYSGSYDFSDPQSLNRYAYVGNDPVNRGDPSGMDPALCMLDGSPINCSTAGMFVNSGAGILGPIRTVRYNPNSDGLGTSGFETFRAVGNNAGWFNLHGVLITVDAYVNGEWAGSATPVFQPFATRSFGGNPFCRS